MQAIAQSVAELAVEMGGAISGEHGDGLSRTQFNELQYGPELMQAFRQVKRAFDPIGLLNPGKILDVGVLAASETTGSTLRYGPDYRAAQVDAVFAFRREGSFSRAVELCNGAGVCLKAEGVMCPSYQATRDEAASTRVAPMCCARRWRGRSADRGLDLQRSTSSP